MADLGRRPILPAPSDSQPGGDDGPITPAKIRIPKRRVNLRGACDLCRSKKVRCDGGRPSCKFCLNRKSRCVYQEDRLQQNEHGSEIIRRLLDSPERQSIELLRRLRSAPSIKSALSVAAGNIQHVHHPSELTAGRAASPPTSSNLEFELMVRYRIVYPTLVPVDAASSIKSLLEFTLQPQIISNDSLVDQGHQSLASKWPEKEPFEVGADSNEPGDFEQALIATAGPGLPPKYCDERLCNIAVSYWTTVSISKDLAAKVLSLYFEVSHPILGFFDADLFLDDLVNKRHDFCSTFLFSAVFAYACQSYTGFDLSCAALSSAFFQDTERLWAAERSFDSILNVAAILMLSACSHTRATNEQAPAADVLDDGRCMAERLNLFGVRHSASLASTFGLMSTNWIRATAHVAYGAYTWVTLNSYYSVLEPIAYPPIFPIPGLYNGQQSQEYLGVSWPPHPLPTHMGGTFTALCGLWRVMQEVAVLYFTGHKDVESLPARVPLAFAESKYLRLLQCASQLQEMSRRDNTPDHVIIFHILLHCAILDIFQPFAHDLDQSQLTLSSSPDSSVSAILQASINQLQRLLLECRMQNPRTLTISHTNAASVHVCNAMLREFSQKEVKGPEYKAYFMLGLATCGEMYTYFSVNWSICRGLLAMAMREGIMSSSEAKYTMEALENRGCHHYQITEKLVGGAFTIDFDLATRKPDEAQAKSIASQFDEMSLFAEYTTGELG